MKPLLVCLHSLDRFIFLKIIYKCVNEGNSHATEKGKYKMSIL